MKIYLRGDERITYEPLISLLVNADGWTAREVSEEDDVSLLRSRVASQ